MSDKISTKNSTTDQTAPVAATIPADAAPVDDKGNPLSKIQSDAQAAVNAGATTLNDIIAKNSDKVPADWQRLIATIEALGVDEVTNVIEDLVTFKAASLAGGAFSGFFSTVGKAIGGVISKL